MRGIGVAVITSTSGTVALVAQRGSLLDPEAMLLVDHHRAEAGEAHPFLDEGVGADGDVDGAVGEPGEDLPPFRPGDAVGEQRHPQGTAAEEVVGVGHLDTVEQSADARGVLLGQHLGRRHERSLMTALHRGEQHAHRHDRLAATDVALQQAVHRMRSGQVGLDLGDRALLGSGEREGQMRMERLHERARCVVAYAERLAFEPALAADEN